MNTSLKSSANQFGLYLGICLLIIFFIAYPLNLDLFFNVWYGTSIHLIIIILGTWGLIKAKNKAGGFITFKDGFSVYFLTILIGLIISGLISYIVFNFLDTNAAEIIKDKSLENSIKILKGLGKSNSEIQTALKLSKAQNLYSISNLLKKIIFNYLLPLSIIGLIIAASIQKRNPETK